MYMCTCTIWILNDFLSLSSTRDFFSLCDGIFLNYHWHRQCLVDTLTVCGKDRAKDVFVGIDVFGRGTFGGGGYDCCIVSATCLESFCILHL